ncbi:metal-dependent phosphohydrolase [Rhizobium oryzicola]|uniref:Metal-dependent phosphohydrolase n=1 Tax=Rhizobium oryzicola TaxID=1232668 RepID=A0ABT8SYI5_9HYPH|nr:metal-dependent phosphohydrolase [Rhizobium oryzicola]MDO1583529.1 metal-dependent phosphohydrolase [Rhizobium oryzicola]
MTVIHITLLQRAESIANNAHKGQSDKIGEPFIEHVRRVVALVQGEDSKIVAWLHDVVEKAPGWTPERLAREGFAADILAAIDAMTKRAGEDYFDFVRRAIANPLARPVKRADLLDNLDQMRRMGGDGFKYEEALRILAATD